MSDTTQEPTMEEILASIRRIISDDGDASEPEREPDVEPESELEKPLNPEINDDVESEIAADEELDDVLDLTDMDSEEPEPLFEEQQYKEVLPDPEPIPDPPPPPAAAPPRLDETLISSPQAQETMQSFSRLNEKLNESYEELPIGNGAVTLEQLARELIRPMLKEWLDQHLPMMAERLVREEIERLVMHSQSRDPW